MRPICVAVTQNRDVDSVNLLHETIRPKQHQYGDTNTPSIADEAIRQLFEYIVFPLRLLLKELGHRYGCIYSPLTAK